MIRIFSAWAFLAVLIISGCKKNTASEERILYGTWVKGTNAGDTLRFYKSNGRNRIAYNLSFNPALPAPVEREYVFIESFRWRSIGKEFELKGIELFSFMSSTTASFIYRKIE